MYLDFSSPYYYDNDYYEPPVYSQRVYRRVQMSAEHVDWCYDRYRSYRESDNTYQPYNGPRRQCYSPYSLRSAGWFGFLLQEYAGVAPVTPAYLVCTLPNSRRPTIETIAPARLDQTVGMCTRH